MPEKEFGGIILMPGCSNNCVFCGRSPRVSDKELKIQEIKVLKNIHHLKKKGHSRIEISGNDPLEYDKIIPLIRYVKSQGFDFIQLSTHGLGFSDDNFLREFVNSGITAVKIPLYGSTAEIHDSVTRNKGSFVKIIKGIKGLKKAGIEIQLCCLLVQQNKDDLVDILKLMKELKADKVYFSIPCLSNIHDLSYYLPIKDQGKFFVNLDKFAKSNRIPITFLDTPYCVFGYVPDNVFNQSGPPDLGKYNQPDKKNRSGIKDMPKYRLKKKEDICRHCAAAGKCDGFFARDVERFGTGNLKPIR